LPRLRRGGLTAPGCGRQRLTRSRLHVQVAGDVLMMPVISSRQRTCTSSTLMRRSSQGRACVDQQCVDLKTPGRLLCLHDSRSLAIGSQAWAGGREKTSARREGVLRVVAEEDAGSGHHATQRVPDLPYLARQLSGGETWTYPQGGYPRGCRLTNGGSGPKSVGGSSWIEL
jgi:hypothetical protein